MEQALYREMIVRLEECIEKDRLPQKSIFLFGHCEATLTLIDELLKRRITPFSIIDNSSSKWGMDYKGIPIRSPETILENQSASIVLMVTRFYEAMKSQLNRMGYSGEVRKLVDYNSYAEYSLSAETRKRRKEQCDRGDVLFSKLESGHKDAFFIFCPFSALGDVYMCMSYLPHFLSKHKIKDPVICTSSAACAKIAGMFGYLSEIMPQKDLDSVIQAVIFYEHKNAFIAHQDRPYVIDLHIALYKKKITFEQIYKKGILGLDESCIPVKPLYYRDYMYLDRIRENRSAIISPYAKSVIPLPERIWTDIVDDLLDKGFSVYTNVVGDEIPLGGTTAISPDITEMKSVVERAGLFIGIRSGLCDVIRTAECRKIVLYPDYYYSDTKWKAIEMYSLDEFENVLVTENYKWELKDIGYDQNSK